MENNVDNVSALINKALNENFDNFFLVASKDETGEVVAMGKGAVSDLSSIIAHGLSENETLALLTILKTTSLAGDDEDE